MNKKLLAIGLIGTMLTGITGCSSSNEATQVVENLEEKKIKGVNEFGWEIPEETLVITMFDAIGNYAPTEQQKIGLENTIKYYKENFNIDLQIQRTAGDGEEALNLALASNDYPDMIYGMSYDMTKKFIEQGRAFELTPYMDTVGKDVKGSMGDMYNMFADDEGKLWYVPGMMGALYELPDNTAHIRYDEYQAIGAPAIETPEDYYNIVNKILEMTPTTPNGEKRYALSFYDQGDPKMLSGFWGLKQGFKVEDDNQLTHWAFTEEGKEMTKYFNQFHLDGTLDPDAFINKFEDWKTKFSNERIVGAVAPWWSTYNAGHEVWNAIDPDTPEDKRYIHVSFKDEEAEATYLSGKDEYGAAHTIITDKAKNPLQILEFINFQATERGRALTNWGIPNGTPIGDTGEIGKFWNIDKEGNWEVDPVAKEQIISEAYSYQNENYYRMAPVLFANQSRWDDGIHCIWGNQMWYEENKWKSIMIENMEGTIYNATDFVLRNKTPDIVMIEQAIEDAWKMNWPQVVQANNDEVFERAWKTLQDALITAGVDQYGKVMSENYMANLAK